LAQEGALRTSPQVGTFVVRMDRQDFARLSEVRSTMKVAMLRAALAVQRDRPVETWRALVAGMEHCGASGGGRLFVRVFDSAGKCAGGHRRRRARLDHDDAVVRAGEGLECRRADG
jgi:DNA-binding GntR family transcriptional regulator